MAALIQINELKQRVAVSFDRTERSYDNALQYILILALLVLVFITFGEILGSVTGYCSDKRKRPQSPSQPPSVSRLLSHFEPDHRQRLARIPKFPQN